MAIIILKKPTPGDLFITDVGIIIPGSGQDTFTNDRLIRELGWSAFTRNAVRTGVLVVNDGVTDLSPAAGEKWIAAQVPLAGFDLGDVASWTGTRYFAVDYDAGSDLNQGYSDVSMADAGTMALKTLERLRALFPKFGNAKKAVVAIRSRTGGAVYRNQADTADDDLAFMKDVYGYEHLLVRGTATIASAGSVAFANDLADKIAAGARLVPGTSVTGYNPSGVITASDFDVLPATLPAEPAVIGKRIRFDSATATVALRNATSMIWLNTASHITLGVNLPAVPTGADVFYIEEPGVAVNRILITSANPNSVALPPSFQLQGIITVGIRTVAVTGSAIVIRGSSCFTSLAFCETPAAATISVSVSSVSDFRLLPTYTDEAVTPATITVGVSLRTDGLTVSGAVNFSASSFACVVFRPQVLNVTQFSVGSASYSAAGALIQGCGLATTPSTVIGGTSLGNLGVATSRRMRSVTVFSGTAISLIFSHALIHGVDMTGAGAGSLITVNAVGSNLIIQDAVGSTGNTGFGLTLTSARDCRIVMGTIAANTFTGAPGQDIQGGGPVFYVHADYARCDLKDNNGNHIQGTAGSIIGNTTIATNDGTEDIGQYKIVRATGSGLVRMAQADTTANAEGVVGITQSPMTAVGPQNAMLANSGASWIQFDAVPTAGNVAYLSTTTPGNAQDTAPAATGTNQTLKIGRILRVLGTLGLVVWAPDATVAGFAILEDVEYLPEVETRATGNATRISQTVLEGGSFKLARAVQFNRILIRLTAYTAPGTLKILIYQRAGGKGGGPATLVASITGFAAGATGNFLVPIAEGTITLSSGVYYLLYGRDSATGTQTLRTYTVQTLDLSNANVQADTHVTNFTTTIAATTSPATFDPRPVATGEATESVLDISLVHRLVRV